MAELLGLVVSLMFLAVVLLPVLTFLRLGRLSRELEELTERVVTLERSAARVTPAVAVPPPPPRQPDTEPADAQAAALASVAVASGRDETAGELRRDLAEAGFGRKGGPVAPEEPDLESRIGGRGLLYAGVLVLILGVSFFLKYAFDNAWVGPTGRVTLGALAGMGLVAAGVRLAARGLSVFGHTLAGLGVAIVYLAIFAALNFYGLLGPALAFVLMALVTIAAAGLADRLRSQGLAFVAVGGGFLTPFLVGGEENAQLTLFTYDALLVAGTLVLAVRQQWLALNAVSYVMTVLTIVAWASRHYTSNQWLRTVLFLTLFCVMFVTILRATRMVEGVTARLISLLLATGPVLYHIAAVVITAAHPPAIHIYLIVFTATGLWLTADPHRPWVRVLVLIASFAPLFGTVTLPSGFSWVSANLVTIVAVAALNLMAILDRALRQDETLEAPELIALHLTGLGLFSLLYQALQPIYPDFRGALAGVIALGAAGLWWLLRVREPIGALNATGLAFTLVAIGVAVEFDGPPEIIGWAAEGAVVVWLGIRSASVAFQLGGLVLWAVAAWELLDGSFATPAAFTAILNTRAFTTFFVIGLGYLLAQLFKRSELASAGRTRAALHVATSALTLVWITAEIRSFWAVRYETAQAYLYEHMMLSLAWGLYGTVLIVAGMKRHYAPVRYIGMTILVLTALKVFFYDLWELGGVYRIIGFLGFGILLMLVSYLYQRRKAQPAN